jgi:hypothetical protein
MKRPVPKYAIRIAVAVALLLVGASLLARWTRLEEPDPVIISAVDPQTTTTMPAAEAIGLCAIRRETGALEGRVTDVAEGATPEETRYRVEMLDGSGRSFHLRSTAVHLDLCDRATELRPDREPIRFEPESR